MLRSGRSRDGALNSARIKLLILHRKTSDKAGPRLLGRANFIPKEMFVSAGRFVPASAGRVTRDAPVGRYASRVTRRHPSRAGGVNQSIKGVLNVHVIAPIRWQKAVSDEGRDNGVPEAQPEAADPLGFSRSVTPRTNSASGHGKLSDGDGQFVQPGASSRPTSDGLFSPKATGSSVVSAPLA
jgi:hypothetical protein